MTETASSPVRGWQAFRTVLEMIKFEHSIFALPFAMLGMMWASDRVNDRGQTPLAGAVFKGEESVIRVLLEAGADPASGTPNAVDTARMFGRTELLELFAAH